MPYISENEYSEKIGTIVRLEEENERLKEEIQYRKSMNTERVRCKKTDCIDHNKELCSPWKCSHYLKNHDTKIRMEILQEIKIEMQNELDPVNRYWKGFTRAITIIDNAVSKSLKNADQDQRDQLTTRLSLRREK